MSAVVPLILLMDIFFSARLAAVETAHQAAARQAADEPANQAADEPGRQTSKRGHATMAGDTATKSDAYAVGAQLSYSISKSLHDFLRNHSDSSSKTESHHQDISNPSRYESEQQWKNQAEQWLKSAMRTVGVGSNINTFKFWREHGKDNEESFADGRYMVWFAKEILLGLAIEGVVPNRDGLNDHDRSPDYDEYQIGDLLIGVLKNWHKSARQLLSKNGGKFDVAHQFGNDPYRTDTAGDEDDKNIAGVMWQMLLQHASLSPDNLRDCLENYSSPQDRYDPPGNIDDGVALPDYFFSWPSFFCFASLEAAGAQEHGGDTNHSNKRRRSNHSETLLVGGEPKSIAWLPLFGYLVTHAFLSSPINMLTIKEKIKFMKENICFSLPSMMNIGNFDHDTKNALLSGIVACVIDKLGEWIVLDGLVLGDEAGLFFRERNEELASADEVMDLLLVDAGILTKLATLTKSPLANLVAEIADAMLNYSIVYNYLCLPLDCNEDQDDENDNYSLLLQQYVTRDAQNVVDFMDKANPQLKNQLLNLKFVPGHYFSSPPHPIVIYTRALLSSNNLSEVSKLSRSLEDCSGIDDSTKRHCYYLLFEIMHDKGVLFEDGWNNAAGGATLANITLGALGRRCALDYLENVVLEAKENLLANLPHSHLHKKQAKQEMLCVKDAVRRTVLKFLLPKAYSTDEALTIATELSDAKNFPQLVNVVWGTNDSKSVACRILASRRLYEDIDKEDEVFDAEAQVNHGVEGSSQATRSTYDDDTTETDGIIMADGEQTIGTEEDNRIFAEASNYTKDEKRDDQVESQVEDGTPSFEESPTQHESKIEHKHSVLAVAAMSSQHQGNNRIDDTSTAQASMDANPWENYDDTTQGGNTDINRSFSVEVDARYHGNAHTNSDDNDEDSSTKLAEESVNTEERAVVREEENAAQVKNDILDGHILDAELTKEECPKKLGKKEEGVVAIPWVTLDDTLTEEERSETLNTSAQGIAYLLDECNTLLGAEEEHDHFYDNAATDDGHISFQQDPYKSEVQMLASKRAENKKVKCRDQKRRSRANQTEAQRADEQARNRERKAKRKRMRPVLAATLTASQQVQDTSEVQRLRTEAKRAKGRDQKRRSRANQTEAQRDEERERNRNANAKRRRDARKTDRRTTC